MKDLQNTPHTPHHAANILALQTPDLLFMQLCVKHHHCPHICNIHAQLPFLFTDCVESSSWTFPGMLQHDSHLNSLHPKPPHDNVQMLCETCNLRILEWLFHTGGRWPWLPNFIGIGKVGSPEWSPFRGCSHVLSLQAQKRIHQLFHAKDAAFQSRR